MRWSIHHVNLEARDVRAAARFYSAVLGLEEGAWRFPPARGYLPAEPDRLALFPDGRGVNTGLHLIAPDPDFARRNNLMHNPSMGGHVALHVDDLDAVAERLRAAGIAFSEVGEFAIPGLRHIYVEDPAGNLLEINGPA
ncbi:Catechol 2,3-dioxygenase [Meinhardsimonia xiamenensis]|jgi:catechol 2,3-dioxygenase-like lactoylglutathione lyase family enzyme|uniref:Catechol 2,3-dioxygenase n=1 Tax=Meinhardsimonia xiamenensis TaxID=990712 RepID=A0A1G8Z500_9RHOB|nr:VOC family protein [Meinhardsimonia xiamenensis]PRX37556.1 catechol 2,3-dioxygenase-like lactoylglutathione lyase family enzyme [Meinhardsimonia xiamenensis]SDK10116.1 Catechol 2,3-dioxygenase [Meinhardsimonia xiamenensis]